MINLNNRKKIVGKIRYEKALTNLVGEHIVWWYGGLKKNIRANSVPHVVIIFRKINSDGTLGEYYKKNILLNFLGLFKIGSIWENGICKYEVNLEERTFTVDFTNNGWSHIRLNDSWPTKKPLPISHSDYPLMITYDKNWILNFKQPNGTNLFIPCFEFFHRCYGRSAEVKRILTTYDWEIALKRLYSPIDLPPTTKQWPVKLGKGLYNDDATILAHILYDNHATKIAKHIHAQIQTTYENNESLCFLKISPWFIGPAKIKVRGLKINNSNAFLGLQVIGCSDPQGVPIHLSRANTNLVKDPVDPETTDKAWQGRPPSRLTKPPTILDLTDYDDPDQGVTTIQIEESSFEILGSPRKVVRIPKEQAESIPGPTGDSKNSNDYSPGEPTGSGKNTGKISLAAPAVMDKQGMLLDMWTACLCLKSTYPRRVTSVSWFTFKDGFLDSTPPSIISLNAFNPKMDREISESQKKWIYHDLNPLRLRGFLVIRITVNNINYYIVEIQRKSKEIKTKHGIEFKEEKFSGLIFSLTDDIYLTTWLRQVQSELRFIKGIMYHLIGECPGRAATFSHNPPTKNKIDIESLQFVINAFNHMDITFR